jgi:AraC family transcriptional regulator, regulatory protein of adaptative response / methylated-DNA-[protein]-cysteine methyltransferase
MGWGGRVMGRTAQLRKPRVTTAGEPGEEIHFAEGQFYLGFLLAAFSEKGVVSIQIGNDPNRLLKELRMRFPKAQLVRRERAQEKRLKRIVDFVEAPAEGLDLPLDIRGTPFQLRVWRAVQKIPCGQIATYTDIASKIGAPKAMRAVGNACSNNRLAIAIPCHRVLRNDDTPSGRRDWGSERQRALLSHEMALPE